MPTVPDPLKSNQTWHRVSEPEELLELPRDEGFYRVITEKDTVHSITIAADRTLWERWPAEGSVGSYDGNSLKVELTFSTWRVGDRGEFAIIDPDWVMMATEGTTGEIVSITREPKQLEQLPWNTVGVFRVTTESGTVHIIDTTARTRWERRPAADSGKAPYDGKSVIVRLDLKSWRVGSCGTLEVSDGSYVWGSTTHRTSEIVSIIRDQTRCQVCGAEVIEGACRRVSDHDFPERRFLYDEIALEGASQNRERHRSRLGNLPRPPKNGRNNYCPINRGICSHHRSGTL